MREVQTRAEVREVMVQVRQQGLRTALVPTMGYLHHGHLTLVDRARELADWVAMSIFVNPLQFGAHEDLDRYPRDIARDTELARARGVDLLFAPPRTEMYVSAEPWVTVVPERGADVLCGASRPGHFRGVLTVVAKLFGIFMPDIAVFGQKDYQQAVLVRRMVEELDYPVRVEIAPTVREPDGLALSSRNAYLSAEQRSSGLGLWRALERARSLFEAGETDAETLRIAMRSLMGLSGVEVEYAEVVDAYTLQPLRRVGAGAVCAVAARVGSTRLIDNLVLAGSEAGNSLAEGSVQ